MRITRVITWEIASWKLTPLDNPKNLIWTMQLLVYRNCRSRIVGRLRSYGWFYFFRLDLERYNINVEPQKKIIPVAA